MIYSIGSNIKVFACNSNRALAQSIAEKLGLTLGDAEVGSTVVVTKIKGDSAYKRRIMDMGITKGSELYIRKVAPLGDPVEITVRGYELSVRKNDAQCVQVK